MNILNLCDVKGLLQFRSPLNFLHIFFLFHGIKEETSSGEKRRGGGLDGPGQAFYGDQNPLAEAQNNKITFWTVSQRSARTHIKSLKRKKERKFNKVRK